jgi:hypothetical protein
MKTHPTHKQINAEVVVVRDKRGLRNHRKVDASSLYYVD